MTGHRVSPSTTGRRGQLVLLAAVALTVSLIPLLVAYLQLGYHADLHGGTGTPPTQQAELTLERGFHEAAREIPREYPWAERSAAVSAVRTRLQPTVEAISESGLTRGIAYSVQYNQTRARNWATANCPSGPDRSFGPCRGDRGIVVQKRADRTHVLAAAFDIRVTTPDSTVELSTTIPIRAG